MHKHKLILSSRERLLLVALTVFFIAGVAYAFYLGVNSPHHSSYKNPSSNKDLGLHRSAKTVDDGRGL